MKQKRIVKSLLPRKYGVSGNFLTVLLLTLSVMFCIGAATLMTTSVGAAANENGDNNLYTGYDDKVEVLYRIEFSDPEKLYEVNNNSVENFSMKDNILYVSPNMVRVKDAGNTGHHSFLGGKGNDVKSDNVTMLAGYKNIVENGNDNSSILGGSGNKIKADSSGAPAVMVGGKGNTIETNKGGAVVLGGSGNVLNESLNTVILGGEKNVIQGVNNVIIGGKKVNVNVNGRNNIFAFSNENSGFRPESENAFYLNLTKGVGIYTDSEKTGMAVSGAVGFGSVNGESCNSSNIGVEGMLTFGGYGCLVGCTEKSKSSGKWELLDRGELCESKCADASSPCMKGTDENSENNQNYRAFCSSSKPASGERCTNNEREFYVNVVFQTKRVYDRDDCGNVGDNKCVYYCEGDNCEIPDEPQNEPSCTGTPPSPDKHMEAKEGSQDGLTKSIAWHPAKDASDVQCAYECSPGYEFDSETETCKPKADVEMVECEVPEGEDRSNYIIKQTSKVCMYIPQRFCYTPVCECKNGLVKNGDKCVVYQCKGTPPEHAYFITGSDERLSEDIQRQVIKHSEKDDNTKKCSYLCESGYVAVLGDIGGGNVGYMCDQCEPGTYDANNPDVCVRVQNCPEGYVRDPSLGSGCYLKGVCRYSNGLEYTGRSFGSIVGNYGDMEPISTQDFNFKCRDNDKYRGEVEPHTCTYVCKTGYYCNGYTCSKPQCKSNKDFGTGSDGKYYYYSTGKAGHYDFHWGYTMIFVTGSNITTSGQFYEQYRNKSGCYYWCPPENRYYVAGSVFLWRCGSLDTVAANQYKCGNLYLYGYGVSTGHAEVNKQGWVYTGDYNAVLNRKGSCIWSCEPGSQVMHGIRMTQKGEEERFGYPGRLFITGSSGKICYKNCLEDGKFMGNDGKCYSCQQGFKLDEETLGISVLSGKEYKEYRGCVPDCPSGSVWRYVDGSYVCMLRKVGGSCPEGYVSDASNDGLCYMCLSTLETYVPGSGCVRNASSE